jgi:hypothetical protein
MMFKIRCNCEIRMRRICMFLCALCLSLSNSFSQSPIELQFIPTWKGVAIDEVPFCANFSETDSICLHVFRFYIHGIQFNSHGKRVWRSSSEHYLIDVEHDESMRLRFNLPDSISIDEVQFILGVDSVLQLNGAHSGVLDPIQGMYWTWQSGYIGWKFEGVELGAGQSTAIQWHVGGFRTPYQTQRTVRLKIGEVRDSKQCSIKIDWLLHDWRSIVPAEVMSPNDYARLLADRFQTCFQIQQR